MAEYPINIVVLRSELLDKAEIENASDEEMIAMAKRYGKL